MASRLLVALVAAGSDRLGLLEQEPVRILLLELAVMFDEGLRVVAEARGDGMARRPDLINENVAFYRYPALVGSRRRSWGSSSRCTRASSWPHFLGQLPPAGTPAAGTCPSLIVVCRQLFVNHFR
jgi:hypothetical protein